MSTCQGTITSLFNISTRGWIEQAGFFDSQC